MVVTGRLAQKMGCEEMMHALYANAQSCMQCGGDVNGSRYRLWPINRNSISILSDD
jgi:hypothetical protein